MQELTRTDPTEARREHYLAKQARAMVDALRRQWAATAPRRAHTLSGGPLELLPGQDPPRWAPNAGAKARRRAASKRAKIARRANR